MTNQTLALRCARPADLSTVASWISGPESCRLWAGPGLRYPLVPEALWADLGASDDNAFTLVDGGAVVGFGQAFPRGEGVVHLARIIVAPRWRGCGTGHVLCRRLMALAHTRHAAIAFTLNVYAGNTAAVALYRALGFVPLERPGSEGLVTMARAALPRSR